MFEDNDKRNKIGFYSSSDKGDRVKLKGSIKTESSPVRLALARFSVFIIFYIPAFIAAARSPLNVVQAALVIVFAYPTVRAGEAFVEMYRKSKWFDRIMSRRVSD